jgi:hypothetical protein
MTYFPESLRQQVRERAQGNCECCLLHERYALKTHEVDHIRAEKHGGMTELENLCLSCFECNRQKGSDLSSVDPIPAGRVGTTTFKSGRTEKSKGKQRQDVLL